ncbi:MAG: hypothetical protein AAFZ01_06240 [Pseudomonadota bacterium]
MTLRRRDFLLAAGIAPLTLMLGADRPALAIDTPLAPNTNLDTPSQTSVFGSPVTTSASNTKLTTSTVAFQNQPNAGARCATCRFYNASDSSCAQVRGDFHSNGWCLLHTP